jgi:hypothetical protein
MVVRQNRPMAALDIAQNWRFGAWTLAGSKSTAGRAHFGGST